jgi:Uma2 family endonuclease
MYNCQFKFHAEAQREDMSIKIEATIEDLYHLPDNCKAEIVNGKLVLMSPTGFLPGRAGGEIYANLRDYERLTKSGYALPNNVGFIINLPNRRSLSPDASFYTGKPTGGKFLNGAPIFAVEVRSENDYGDKAEEDMASKRRDYFAAGTAEAEPAVPGWTMLVDNLFV